MCRVDIDIRQADICAVTGALAAPRPGPAGQAPGTAAAISGQKKQAGGGAPVDGGGADDIVQRLGNGRA
ncbi:hypothetical protein ABU162_20045 [Paenibacillus thiaminolyticus]|uniref:hypothetical protein n=1 Tax=Paenibacillus thiaminolyticus TaxID=49283 RepID=UPI0035A644AE